MGGGPERRARSGRRCLHRCCAAEIHAKHSRPPAWQGRLLLTPPACCCRATSTQKAAHQVRGARSSNLIVRAASQPGCPDPRQTTTAHPSIKQRTAELLTFSPPPGSPSSISSPNSSSSCSTSW